MRDAGCTGSAPTLIPGQLWAVSRQQAQGTHPNASESREAPFGPQESPTAPAYCLAITKCVGEILRVGLLVFHGKAKALREHLSLQGQEASNAPAKKLPGTVEGRGV